MPMEHYRPKNAYTKAGYYQGGYCSTCGAGGISMYGHYGIENGGGICEPNRELVDMLNEANTVEAENKREFTRKLKGQPSWTR